jgi:hypothetical protein
VKARRFGGGERGRAFLRANDAVMAGAYGPGDVFGMHTDTGLHWDAAAGTASCWTLLLYLDAGCAGGETVFYDDAWRESARVAPAAGTAVLFDIATWHRAAPVAAGRKAWLGCEVVGHFENASPVMPPSTRIGCRLCAHTAASASGGSAPATGRSSTSMRCTRDAFTESPAAAAGSAGQPSAP